MILEVLSNSWKMAYRLYSDSTERCSGSNPRELEDLRRMYTSCCKDDFLCSFYSLGLSRFTINKKDTNGPCFLYDNLVAGVVGEEVIVWS
jgi:hypothetical protein